MHTAAALPQRTSRRRLLETTLALAVTGLALASCTKPAENKAGPSTQATGVSPVAATEKPAGDLTVGFIFVGPKDDFGYNQAHAEGAKSIASLPGVKLRQEEKVPETVDVEQTMESMINLDGAKVLFPTSFGYFSPHILKLAEKYPEVTFFHCGGLYDETKHPKNVGSLTTKTNKLGFVAAKPIPQVLRNINAYTLGARSVNPKATLTVIFTGDWAMPTKEAEATNSLIDQGADVITAHVDSPKVVIENAERRGVFSTGYHANQSALAPKGYLTGAEWNWSKVYGDYIEKMKAKAAWKHLVRGGFKEGYIKMSAYGEVVSADAKTKADQAKEQLTAGSLVIFKGPIKDNTGKEQIAAGTDLGQTDITLENMNYLVEGVNGKI
jgi:basic membrane protein A and related proteins